MKSIFEGSIDRFATTTGKRIFFNPAVMNRKTAGDIPSECERKYPVACSYAYTQADTLQMILPSGWELEASPPHQEISVPFGYYRYHYSLQDQHFKFIRVLRIDQNHIPPEQYADYLEFMNSVVMTDNSKFVLKQE